MFEIIGDLMWGQAFGCLEKEEYHPWIVAILSVLKGAAAFTSVLYVGGWWLVWVLFRTLGQRSVAALRRVTDELLSRRLAMEKGRNDLLEGLISHREAWDIPFEKLAVNGFLLTFADSETSATSLCGTTYLLLTHPEAMEKLKQEIRTRFRSAGEITMNATARLPYLTPVINESLPMYPPAALDLVRIGPPEGWQIAGQDVAGGAEVQPWSINHSSDNWTDLWTFNPDRFLHDEDEAKKAGNILEALQPFSWGPRNCIGRNLAFAEMRLILSRIVFDFDMRLGAGSDDWIGRQRPYPLWSRMPLHVHCTPVKRD